ncbi:hypothetical protein BY996DRAFT_6543244 [Phakopsora pachyrhizi]|nr:hypothetical protein BY996DRAFT_6543244 [Phakopsora pachyrhizi]
MRREIVKIGGVVPIDETLSDWPGETGTEESLFTGEDGFLNHGVVVIARVNLRGRDLNIDAIADEVQNMNQTAPKIALAVMSKMDGKPDDVHDEENHTMIEGMLSDKEFRKTLPAGLLNLFNENIITILMDATKKATNATAAILGNHNKTTNPGTFLNSLNSSNGSTSQFLSRPSKSQQSKEGSMSMARDILLGNCNIDTLFQPSTHSQKQSNQECCYLSGGFDRADWILAWIEACNYYGTSLGLNVVNPSSNHSPNLRSSLPSQLTGSKHGQWSTLSLDPGQVLIDDQLAKQLGVTTRTDDQISRPSVTPVKDSIGHHPPKEFSTYVKREF